MTNYKYEVQKSEVCLNKNMLKCIHKFINMVLI